VSREPARALRLGAATVVVAVFLLALAGQAEGLASYRWDVDAGYLLMAGIVALLRGPLIVYPWWRIVRSWGFPLGWWRAVRLYFHSGLARYVPGQWWFVPARAYLAQREGVPPSSTAASIVLETVVVTGAAVGVALLGLAGGTGPKWSGESGAMLWAPAIIAPILLAGTMRTNLPVRLWNRVADFLKRGHVQPARLSKEEALVTVIGAYGNWLLYGVVAALTLQGISGFGSGRDGITVIGIYAASVLGGAVLLFVPQGIVVREGVLVYLLNTMLGVPVPEALVAAALTRLIAMAAEGLWAAAALGIPGNRVSVGTQQHNDAKE
jgi:glycosyltransferase 2 family protein